MGEAMRFLRNQDFYGGGILVTDKDSREYLRFVERVLIEIELRIKQHLRSREDV
jgi:ABC-type lipopolysaccharide export system ATPase subunit